MLLSILLLWRLLLVVAAPDSAIGYMITKDGCNETCKNSKVLIPYPFGIGKHCSHNSSYEIICKPSNHSSLKPFLYKYDIEVLNITFKFDGYNNSNTLSSSDSYQLVVANEKQEFCSDSRNNNSNSDSKSRLFVYKRNLRGSPFAYSWLNQIVVQGCAGQVSVRNSTSTSSGDNNLGECTSFCPELGNSQPSDSAKTTNNIVSSSDCNGQGCCLISMSNFEGNYYDYLEIEWRDLSRYDGVAHNNNNTTSSCVNMYLMGDQSSTYISSSPLQSIWIWTAPYDLGANDGKYDYYCIIPFDGIASYCSCKYGYKGNPYLPHGCQAISHPSKKKFTIIGIAASLGSTTFLVCCYGFFHVTRRWIQIKRKANFFKRNGGLLLQQQITTIDNKVDITRVFSVDELDKATDNFNANRILGQGGQGTVYKGMLLDGRVVAIKKSLKVDESQIEQFINEVVILSQINHRNVVKLFGCCLETEVPLLVYEFIQNGTLGDHIHDPNEKFLITWKMRLQIAVETAEALRYLHSASGTPIYHRDIKSSNILLDDKYKAKVADFGTSRTVMIDQTHLTTVVQGTLGYLDPEYYQTTQFTEKSDVYSFGVVLVELLTGKKPLSSVPTGGWRSLAMDFLLHMETSSLLDIIDSRIIDEAKEEELLALASLAKRCLNLNGKQRPTMREVSNVLEGIRSSSLPSTTSDIDYKEYYEILEMGKICEGQVTTRTCESENIIGASYYVEVKPLPRYCSF